MNPRGKYMTMENLTPELREKLSRFLEVERWHRALLSSYATRPEQISRRSWEAAFNEVPLSPDERKIYKELDPAGAAATKSRS